MLHEYAIDPTGLRRRGPMWMLLEQFGVSKGRLVAGFPKYWSRMVYDAVRATDCPDIEKAWILERLRKHKSSLGNLSGPRDYSGVSWIDSAVESNIQNPFRAIISEETVPNVENYLNPLDATDDHPVLVQR